MWRSILKILADGTVHVKINFIDGGVLINMQKLCVMINCPDGDTKTMIRQLADASADSPIDFVTVAGLLTVKKVKKRVKIAVIDI